MPQARPSLLGPRSTRKVQPVQSSRASFLWLFSPSSAAILYASPAGRRAVGGGRAETAARRVADGGRAETASRRVADALRAWRARGWRGGVFEPLPAWSTRSSAPTFARRAAAPRGRRARHEALSGRGAWRWGGARLKDAGSAVPSSML